MATRALIGYVTDNGKVRGNYNHFDGYPEHVGAILLEEYRTPEAVNALTQYEIRVLNTSREDVGHFEAVEYFEDGNEQRSWDNAAHFFGDWDLCGTEYHYLLDAGEWTVQSRWADDIPNEVTLNLGELLDDLKMNR